MIVVDNTIPLRIAVTGVTGRMGKEIIQSIIMVNQNKKVNKTVILGAAIARVGSNICGMDIGTVMKSNTTDIIITDDLNTIRDDFDILVDFTTPEISMEYIKFCANNNKNMVIGTTGFNKNHKSFIKEVSQKIGIVYSANFSIGVILMSKLLSIITHVIGNITDINIIETHHNKKIDTPSGTALMMKDIIIDALSSVITDDMIKCNMNDDNGKAHHTLSSCYNIPVHSIRAGNFVGEHSVLFTGIEDSLQITHKAFSRVIFADGVLRSVVWLGSKIGLFNMYDVLGI